MRVFKLRYIMKHKPTGNIHVVHYSLSQIEQRPLKELSVVFSDEHEMLSRDVYTGLKDKNDKKIYEGDIVKISEHPFGIRDYVNGNYEVNYSVDMELSAGNLLLHRMLPWCEVIGNIHEHPHLLKVITNV